MNDDDNSGFSINDLGFTDDNNGNNNSNNSVPGINGGFTSSDLHNNENTNNLTYDFSNMSNSNNSTFLNNGGDSSNNISTGSGSSSLINVISDNESSGSNSIFHKPKSEENQFNVPPDLEGGFNSPPPEDDGDFIVPPNFSSSNISSTESNLVDVQSNQNVQNTNINVNPSPNPSSNINLIDAYQEEEDEGVFNKLFSKKKNDQNNNVPGFSVKNKILREKSIFTDFEVFKSFSKVVVDVIIFVVVAGLLYKLYVKENTNVVKKLPRDTNHYNKVCTVERPFNDTVIMSGAFGLYEYDGKVYLDEVVMWTARSGKIKIPDGQTESEVVDNFVGLSGNSVGIEKGTVIAVNNYYKKPGMVFTSQTTAYDNGQYTIDILVQKYLEYGANCV